jgi:hypothetical protein
VANLWLAPAAPSWLVHHGERPVKAATVVEPVRVLVDPQGPGRQHIAARLVQLTGTRAGGFVLTREEGAGKLERAPGGFFGELLDGAHVGLADPSERRSARMRALV